MYEVPVSVFCAGEHVVWVASTQDEKCTETEDQKKPEKKTACMQIAGYSRMCLGGKVRMKCFWRILEFKDWTDNKIAGKNLSGQL